MKLNGNYLKASAAIDLASIIGFEEKLVIVKVKSTGNPTFSKSIFILGD
jgi:hypothetical protein